MPMPVVWSERPELNAASLKDCTYSGALQALVFGGKVEYQHGIYTAAEREALERSDDQPDETGASLDDVIVAVKRRYGIDLVKNRVELLDQHHDRADLAFVIQGVNGNLAAGHPQRRWDPSFVGPHCVTIIPTGDGTHVKWLDPLAPNKFAGDTVLWATVTKWIGNMPSAITVRKDAYAPPKVYTQAQMDAAMAACKAANVIAVNASYNSGLTAAAAAVSAVPRK